MCIVKIENRLIEPSTSLSDILMERRPGDVVAVVIKREGKEQELRVTLSEETGGGFGGGGMVAVVPEPTLAGTIALPRAWAKPNYKLAVIGVEYPDVKHNPKITDEDWEESLFSRGKYTGKSATGQTVARQHGRLLQRDLLRQVQGRGQVRRLGRGVEEADGVLDRQRDEQRARRSTFLTEVMDKVLAKNGKDALKDYDGVFILFAGGRVQTTRGSLYWPHRSSFSHNGKRWPYFIVQEGGDRMTDISVFCHEFGHMLGLPDLYARPEVPGHGRRRRLVRHVAAAAERPAAALLRLEQGAARLGQADGDRPAGEAEADPVADRGRPDGVLQGDRAHGRQRVLPAGEPAAEGVRREPAGGRAADLAGDARRRTGRSRCSWRRPTASKARAGRGSLPARCRSRARRTRRSRRSRRRRASRSSAAGWTCTSRNIRRLPDGRVTFHIGYEYQ